MTKDVTYQEEQQNNELLFKEMLKKIEPNLYVLFDLLKETKINPFVVWKVIRQLSYLSKSGGGGGYGIVKVEVQNDQVLFVRGEEADRINQPLTISIPDDKNL